MESALLTRGLELMLVGMGTVFVFLSLLVAATSLMSAIVIRRAPPGDDAGPGAGPDDGPTPEEIAAISAAVRLHRSSRGNRQATLRD